MKSDKTFALEALHGLHAFQLEASEPATWYCFTASVAHALHVTTRAVAQSVSRHLTASEAASVLCVSRSSHAGSFGRILSTYSEVKRLVDGTVDSLNSRKGDKFSLYPLALVTKLLALPGSASKVDSGTLRAVNSFLNKQKQQAAAGAADGKEAKLLDESAAGSGSGSGAGSSSSDSFSLERKEQPLQKEREVKVKIEPASPRALPVSSLVRGIPVIDLTNPATLAALARLEGQDRADQQQHALEFNDLEQTLSSLVDNFALWHPVQEEYSVLREYGLRPDEVADSVLLQEQCQRFSEYRQEIWNWHRDPSQVTPRTVGNNIRVLLLFGGFVCHSAKRHRLKPASFDMSVFGSKHIEAYIMNFLQYLHGSRGLMFSTIANYLNSLVVLAKFYFTDNPLADLSFTAERVDSEFVLSGLRRVRSQTNAKAKSEALQKPLHAQWLSWPECQQVRRACLAAYLEKADEKEKQEGGDRAASKLLKSLVCLLFYTIAPPPRCSIVRLLQWRTTLVKKRADPCRYVIDLLNNPDAPASQHKTVKFYRRAILPLPKSMTPYLDKLRSKRKSDWVFVNSHGEPYTTTAWTHFVKATFRKHSGDKKKAPSASLARSIFVTWLNGVPYDSHDSPFLNEMKLTAAEYQTHSLAIANSHYDKDAASEAKLRVLVDFCDSYSQWQPDDKAGGAGSASASFSGLSDAKDNVDSDDEGGSLNSGPADMELGEDNSAPAGASSASLASSSSAAAFAASALPSALPAEIKKQPARPASAKARASSSSSARKKKKTASSDGSDSSDSDSSSSSSDDENEDEQAADADDAEYLPDRIIAKKTVGWQDIYLIHWLGYTAAERTWEPAAYFDQYCTKQTHDYEQARRPVRILARKARPGDSKSAQELFFEVQWQGRSSETSMEREESMLEDFADVVKDWQRREEERKSRKHPRDGESKALKGQQADGGSAEQPAKRRCKGAGASSTSGS